MLPLEIENTLRSQLKAAGSAIPNCVINGSYQTAVQWKDDVRKAHLMSTRFKLCENSAREILSRLSTYK
jgi:hypothetical protein